MANPLHVRFPLDSDRTADIAVGPVGANKRLMHRGKSSADRQMDYPLLFRGNTTLNSVKRPGSVSTSILPPCCFTIMSWLIDRPSPVPSPVGLVVKNG